MPTNNIRTHRDALGVSSYELARRAGVSQPTVINWERRERARTITLASLERAAAALDCDVRIDFIPRSPQPQKPSSPPPVRTIDPNAIWGG
ncbi:MAG TPA: helix-turn-helix domain-containing protein [Kiritimatiellia bacterium]|nr:helix-turn-helix domain-containing protein [Kiritimatiellia bacterium]